MIKQFLLLFLIFSVGCANNAARKMASVEEFPAPKILSSISQSIQTALYILENPERSTAVMNLKVCFYLGAANEKFMDLHKNSARAGYFETNEASWQRTLAAMGELWTTFGKANTYCGFKPVTKKDFVVPGDEVCVESSDYFNLSTAV